MANVIDLAEAKRERERAAPRDNLYEARVAVEEARELLEGIAGTIDATIADTIDAITEAVVDKLAAKLGLDPGKEA